MGVKIVEIVKEVWDVDMVVKVKELIVLEYIYFKEGLLFFIYLYLVNELMFVKVLMESKVNSVVYEIVEFVDYMLLLFLLMSEVVG